MDSKDFELFANENIQLLKEFNRNFIEFKEILAEKKDHIRVSGQVEVNTEKSVTVENLDAITESVDQLGETLEKAIADNSYKPQPIEVANIKDAQAKDVTISNLTDIKAYFDSVTKAIKDNQPIVKITKQEVVFPTDPKKPIAVRLSDGKVFYNALVQAISGSVGVQHQLTRNNGTAIAVVNEDGSPISGGSGGLAKPTDAYKYCAEALSGGYEYSFYEDVDGNWYIARELLATGYIDFTAGTGGVATVYDDNVSPPTGSLTYDTYAGVF